MNLLATSASHAVLSNGWTWHPEQTHARQNEVPADKEEYAVLPAATDRLQQK